MGDRPLESTHPDRPDSAKVTHCVCPVAKNSVCILRKNAGPRGGVAAPGDRVPFVPHSAPTVADLRRTSEVFNGFAGVDDSWDTAPGLDLSFAEHRTLLLRWPNSWGCRIRYPKPGEPAPFDSGVSVWWQAFGASLPQVSLVVLEDADTDGIAAAYTALTAAAASEHHTLGPTAAAKALYALSPRTIMPWDAAIAAQLHGRRDESAFAEHLRLGRAWARAVLAEAGTLPGLAGRPSVPPAKILDEYLYVTITMRGGQSNGHGG
jgi:hypothetical protein